jgi:broad specificity phosphatase PhoE
MRRKDRWPASLVLVRHGESIGNVARREALASGAAMIDVAQRDMDVPLSPQGQEQADALGRWLRRQRRNRPSVALASPHVRAHDTAVLALRAADLALPVVLDERLREREFGVLDRLTRLGIAERQPEQARARARVGKFYHRPPGGESWCDVALRVRSALDSIAREHGGEHVLVVTHEVVILMFRYVLERLTEAEVLGISREHDIVNCSLTSFVLARSRPDGMVLRAFNEVVPLEESGAPVTAEPDVPVAPR